MRPKTPDRSRANSDVLKMSFGIQAMDRKLKYTSKQKLLENCHGFTLMELMVGLAVIGVLVTIAVPNFLNYRNKARIASAISEIKLLEKDIAKYEIDGTNLPDSLSDVRSEPLKDPWGNPYQYLRIEGGTDPDLINKRRKNKDGDPANSDYDLYSLGHDGRTEDQFTDTDALDDIVRADDGQFYGLAEDH